MKSVQIMFKRQLNFFSYTYALLLPVQGRHIGVHKSGDATLIEVEACTHFKQIVESV